MVRPLPGIGPILEKVIGEFQGTVILAKINTDDAHNLAATFRIEGIPLVIAFRQGKPVAEFVGVRPEALCVHLSNNCCPAPPTSWWPTPTD